MEAYEALFAELAVRRQQAPPMATQPQPVSPQLDPVRVFGGFASETAAPRSITANPADLAQLHQPVRQQRALLWKILHEAAATAGLGPELATELLAKHHQPTGHSL
jgi:hypothetical protein